MPLRHLIVLIINARNICIRATHNHRVLMVRSKKTKNSRGPASLPGVRVKQGANLLFTMLIEPATRLNKANCQTYTLIIPAMHHGARKSWWSQTGSNRRPPACKAGALPAELWPQNFRPPKMVGPGRLELPTSRLSGVRSNHLSYAPKSSPRLFR